METIHNSGTGIFVIVVLLFFLVIGQFQLMSVLKDQEMIKAAEYAIFRIQRLAERQLHFNIDAKKYRTTEEVKVFWQNITNITFTAISDEPWDSTLQDYSDVEKITVTTIRNFVKGLKSKYYNCKEINRILMDQVHRLPEW